MPLLNRDLLVAFSKLDLLMRYSEETCVPIGSGNERPGELVTHELLYPTHEYELFFSAPPSVSMYLTI